MKVLFIAPVFYPQIGGGENLLFNLSKALGRLGHKVYILSPASSVKGYKNIEQITIFYISYLAILRTPVIYPHLLMAYIDKIKPDIIQSSGPTIMELLTPLLAKQRRIPILTIYHADLNLEKLSSRIFTNVYTSYSLRIIDKIIVTTERYKQILTSRGISASKIAVIPPGIDTKIFYLPKGYPKFQQRTKHILFVGRLDESHKYKRVDLLIEAMAYVRRSLPHVYLWIVGKGDYKKELEKLAQSLGLKENIYFAPCCPVERLVEYYRQTDLFVLPSPTKAEGFGIVLLEAMACSCPIITSTECGGAEVVCNSNAGLLYEGSSVKDLAKKIILILSNPELSRKFSKNGTLFAKKFDWDEIGRKAIELYETL